MYTQQILETIDSPVTVGGRAIGYTSRFVVANGIPYYRATFTEAGYPEPAGIHEDDDAAAGAIRARHDAFAH
jgi:hypothetical protein